MNLQMFAEAASVLLGNKLSRRTNLARQYFACFSLPSSLIGGIATQR